jgi:hypothetical protein
VSARADVTREELLGRLEAAKALPKGGERDKAIRRARASIERFDMRGHSSGLNVRGRRD